MTWGNEIHRTALRAASIATAVAALTAASAASAQKAEACDSGACVRKDIVVSAEGFPRVSVAAGPRQTPRLAISSRLLSCGSRVAVHAFADAQISLA